MEPVIDTSFLNSDEQLYISPEGIKTYGAKYDPRNPNKNLLFTTDYDVELPIVMKKSGAGNSLPHCSLTNDLSNVKDPKNLS